MIQEFNFSPKDGHDLAAEEQISINLYEQLQAKEQMVEEKKTELLVLEADTLKDYSLLKEKKEETLENLGKCREFDQEYKMIMDGLDQLESSVIHK